MRYYFLQVSLGKIQSCPCASLIKHYNKKTYDEADVQIHVFLTLEFAGGKWSASLPGRFIPGERVPGTYVVGGWVNSRVAWTL